MKVIYLHYESNSLWQYPHKFYGLRLWKKYAKVIADNRGELRLVRRGITVRVAYAHRYVDCFGQPFLVVTERAVKTRKK